MSANVLRYCLLIVTIIGTVSTSALHAQQRYQYSQYMFNGFAINPACAGYHEVLSATVINRSQWRGVEGAPSTQTLTGNTLFKNKHVGLGASLFQDRIGIHRTQTALAAFAYRLEVAKETYLSFGLQAGVNHQRSDYASLAGQGTDPNLFNVRLNITYPTIGAGLFLRSRTFEVGLSAPQLLKHPHQVNDTLTISFSSSPVFAYGKLIIPVSTVLDIEPSLLIKHTASGKILADINAMLIISRVVALGVSYRQKEAIVFLLKGQITPQLQAGFAYDFDTGVVKNLAASSNELMINYQFRYFKKQVASPR